ncbi:MAG: hypothetical protein LBB23_03775 [Rickettsiales bacterium]|jgi:hypothetical protein|nr:hypothetical protein [Rickettsiales bacterium]
MLNTIKNIFILVLLGISCLWAWEKFGYLIFKKTGGLTPDSTLADWNRAGATERESSVRAVLSEPARVSRLTDCITIMATVSESARMTVRDAVPVCMGGTAAASAFRGLINE